MFKYIDIRPYQDPQRKCLLRCCTLPVTHAVLRVSEDDKRTWQQFSCAIHLMSVVSIATETQDVIDKYWSEWFK